MLPVANSICINLNGLYLVFFFFFQAEDGIRDLTVTGVQTCALPIYLPLAQADRHRAHQLVAIERHAAAVALDHRELAQLHALEGGEAEIAGDAHAPPADHGRVLGRTRVLHLRIETVAVRAAHPLTLTGFS